MKGTLRFMIMFLAVFSLGVMVLPRQANAGTSFSISVDAYPISFAFSDSSPDRVYVEREVTHYHYRDLRPNQDGCRYQHDYHGQGYNHRPYQYHGRYQDQARWYHR